MQNKYISVLGFGSVLLGASSVLSRLLGVLRDHVFAQTFGSSMDAYFLAFRIPDLIYSLLVFGGLSAAFVPIYTRLLKKSDHEASAFGSDIFNVIFIVLTIAVIIFYFLAPLLLPLIALGFSEEVLSESVSLTRIMLISPLFLGLSAVLQGIQNSKKVFYGIALAPIIYNGAIIFAAYFYGKTFDLSAIAWGVAVGSALHFLIQIPFLFKLRFSYLPKISIKSVELKKFLILCLPRIFGLSVAQLGILVDTTIASLLLAGSLSIYNFSINLQSLPYAVIAVSFTVAIFSSLSEQSGDKARFIATIRSSTSLILFWVLPAVAGIFILRSGLVDFVLGGGAFDESAAKLTALTLGIFIWAAIPQSLVPLFARGFYALENTKTPVICAFVSVTVNIVMGLVLTQLLHLPVWALAVSAICSNFVNVALLSIALSRKFGISILMFFDFRAIMKIFFTSALMAVSVYASLRYSANIGEIISIFFPSIVGLLVYFACARLFKTTPSLREVQASSTE